MKKIVLTLLAVMAVSATFAQIKWDARLGAVVSKFTETDTKMKLGMKAGVGVEFDLGQQFSLRPGLFYTMKGSSKDDSFATSNDKAFNLSYLEVPVLASYRFDITQSFALAVNAGPYVGLRLNSPDWGRGLKAADFGLNVGLDFIFGKFVLGPEIEYGFTKVGLGDDKNLAYSLCLGYKF